MKLFPFVLTTGFALFAMFFGAGNLVFPLQLGCKPELQHPAAVAGFLITAVAVPLFGYLSIMLYKGDYRAFFQSCGKWTSLLVPLVLLAVMGPFGGIPRCAALTFAAFKQLMPSLSPLLFCGLFCSLVFLFAYRENNIISLLGKILTPLLLTVLAVQLVVGLIDVRGSAQSSVDHALEPFTNGLFEGYYTLDLIAAIFFSSFMYPHVRAYCDKKREVGFAKLVFGVALVAGSILSVIYVGFFTVASHHAEVLQECPKELLLIQVSQHLLGEYAGVGVACMVGLACLTTSIALSAIVADFVRQDLLKNRFSYEAVLAGILITALGVAVQEFTGIEALLGPVVTFLYPFLILLCIYNCLRVYLKNRESDAVTIAETV